MTLVIAIDGPAGTGKSSAAKSLAQKYNFVYVDTGAVYRALAYLVDINNIDPNNTKDIVDLIPKLSIIIDSNSNFTKIIVDNKNLESELRTENISRLASIISQHQKVREALLPVQRNLALTIQQGAIFEGRDIGTVVFPKAPLKIFITATSETRAQRRFQEIQRINPAASYQDILSGIKKRDERDETRSVAPMQKASDSYVIDTSHMSLLEVVDALSKLVEKTKHISGSKLW